ncbi:SpoIIE family protein phosphatase [Streptomyces sp. NPDC057445]|uniref:SpoIIE family protein phosphatase n=1 Tax=Streptomyces sp. NPDC057445 TaxID=3346136 RepID=UPI0036D029E1
MTRPHASRHNRAPALLAEAYTAAATTDGTGCITGWSPEAARLLGCSSRDVIGRPAVELLARPVTEHVWAHVTGGRRRWTAAVALRHGDGRPLDVSLLAHRRTNSAGDSEWLIVSAVLPEDGADEGSLRELAFTEQPLPMAVYDTGLRVVRVNRAMERALDLREEVIRGLRTPEIVPAEDSDSVERAMRQALGSGETQHVTTQLEVPGRRGRHSWAVSLIPLQDRSGQMQGVCLRAHDLTDEYRARQRLVLVNEASRAIGSTLDVRVTAQELTDAAVPQLADFASVDLLTFLERGDEPSPAALTGSITLHRAAHSSVLDGTPEVVVPVGGEAVYPEHSPPAESVSAGRSAIYELTDTAMARWASHDPVRAERIRTVGTHSLMLVPLRARGVTLGVAAFTRHRQPAPFTEDDLLLAEEITARAAVCIDNARRYVGERSNALTLQRSLLPQVVPVQNAVDVASRYIPAGGRAGVGGDWFDVIPLSGARVALVVGDVVGHGMRASANMGRLRTAVRTLADIDLPPDELLAHLDDLVVRLSEDRRVQAEGGEADTNSDGDVGATCLYAVYDPVSRQCSLARAGHPAPALVTPGGEVEFLDLPPGPPLGLGGFPFEASEIELPEGSLLGLYTNGLVDARDRDVDARQRAFADALADPSSSLDTICDTVLETLVPGPPEDDVALLLARTRALDRGQVATWDLPRDPAVVARSRRAASEQLAEWGLDEAVFTTELVVSELVTNAIRYGSEPIQLRLIRDRTLICEVSDGSNTAPHLRRARTFDEGGRGLMLVAQLTQRWGTRQARTGKTIWAEQHYPDGGSPPLIDLDGP